MAVQSNSVTRVLNQVKTYVDTMEYELVYHFDIASVALRTDNIALANFITGYSKHFFNVQNGNDGRITVYASVETKLILLFQSLFVIERDILLRNGYVNMSLGDEVDIIYEEARYQKENCNVYYIVNKPHRKIIVLVSACNDAGKYTIMRTVRSLIKLQLIEHGMVPFHAACVVKNNYGIAFTGNKFSGKTTTLINMLSRGGYQFLSNDKVLLMRRNSSFHVYGLPTAVGVRVGTLRLFNNLKSLIDNGAELDNINNEVLDEFKLSDPHTRIYFTPNKFAALLRCQSTRQTKLQCLVFPELLESAAESKLVQMSKNTAQDYLLGQYLDIFFPHQPYWNRLVKMDSSDWKAHVNAVIDQLSAHVPVYRLIQNKGTNNHTFELLNQLGQVS